MSSHFHSLRVKDIRRETNDCVSIAFEVPEDLKELFAFHPGQNITVRFKNGNDEIRRSYSICSTPDQNELRIAVKKVPEGRFSSHANQQLQIGDSLEVLPPSGKFYTSLHKNHKKDYLAVAAGSGITPILSIVGTTLATEPGSTFSLIYGNRNRSSIIFREQLDGLKNRYMSRLVIHHVFSRETIEAPIYNGRINAEKCREFQKGLLNILAMDEIFLCGPAEMIFSVKTWLEEQNYNQRNIHYELFGTPVVVNTMLSKEPDQELQDKISQVSIKLDGIAFDYMLPYAGLSILDASLKQGADLPYACKGGVCATCKAKLVEGEVQMMNNFALEPDELAAGYILTCQSHPRSEKVMVDFDSRG